MTEIAQKNDVTFQNEETGCKAKRTIDEEDENRNKTGKKKLDC